MSEVKKEPAIEEKEQDLLQTFLKEGRDFVPKGIFGLSPFLFVAFQGDADLIEQLLYDRANSSECDDGGNTALMWAAREGHVNVVKTLLKFNVDTDQQDSEGRTAFIWAARQGHTQVIQALKEVKAIDHKDKNGRTALMHAAFQGHLEPLVHLINNGSNVDHCDHDGCSSLMYACQQGHFSIAQYLILNNANISAVDNFSRTALIYAAVEGFLEIVKELFEFGADVNCADISGWTPLVHVAKKGHVGIVEYLLQCGAKLLYIPKAIETAATEGHVEVVVKLVCHANYNQPNIYGISPISWTVILNDLIALDTLLLMKVSPTDVDDYGEVSIMDCARHNNSEALKKLLSSHKCVSYQNAKGNTAMDIAVKENHYDIINILEDFDKRENEKNKGKSRPRTGRPTVSLIKQTEFLMSAAKRGHWRVLKVLLDKGVDSIRQDQQGRTALHYAASANKESVEILLTQIHPNVQDKDGKTALHLALEAEEWEISSLLLKHGASNLYNKQRITAANVLFDKAASCAKAKDLLKTMLTMNHTEKTLHSKQDVCENVYTPDRTIVHENESLMRTELVTVEEPDMPLDESIDPQEIFLDSNKASLCQQHTSVDQRESFLYHNVSCPAQIETVQIGSSLQNEVDSQDAQYLEEDDTVSKLPCKSSSSEDFEPVYDQVMTSTPTSSDQNPSIYFEVDTDTSSGTFAGQTRSSEVDDTVLNQSESIYSEVEAGNNSTGLFPKNVRSSGSEDALLATKNLIVSSPGSKNDASVSLDKTKTNSRENSCGKFDSVLQESVVERENVTCSVDDKIRVSVNEGDQDSKELETEKQDVEANHKQDNTSCRKSRPKVHHVRFAEINDVESNLCSNHKSNGFTRGTTENTILTISERKRTDPLLTEDLYEDILQTEVSCHGHMQVNSCLRSFFGPTDNAQLMINFSQNPKLFRKGLTNLKLSGLSLPRKFVTFFFECFLLYYGQFIVSITLFNYHQNHNEDSNVAEFIATLAFIILVASMLLMCQSQIKDRCFQNLGYSYNATVVYRKIILGKTVAEMYSYQIYKRVVILLSFTQLLPAFVSFHHIGLDSMLVKYDSIKVLCSEFYKELLAHYTCLGNTIDAINILVAFGLSFPQLILVLSVINSDEMVPTIVIVCMVITALSVSIILVKLEARDKSPAKVSFKGQFLLFATFLLRFFPRTFCIAEFLRCFGPYILFIYVFHIVAVLLLHYVADRQYGTKVFDPQDFFTLRRTLSACFNLFQFIPRKTYGHGHKTSYTKVIFLNLVIFEDLFMVSWTMGYGETIPLIGDHFLLFIILLWLFSILFLTAYYKYGHPWRWNIKFGRQMCKTVCD